MEKGEVVYSSSQARSSGFETEFKPSLRHRKASSFSADYESFDEFVKHTSSLSLDEPVPQTKLAWYWRHVISPALITALGAYVRLQSIAKNQKVIWDEAHFGKFGSHYIQHEFYFDVHPPLGKLLVALSGYLAGFDGEFKFESNTAYPEGNQFTYMRIFNCLFGIACVPMAYFTALELNFSMWTTWFVSLSFALELLSLILSKFILLDSMLLCFTVSTFLCLTKLHTLNMKKKLLSLRGLVWLSLTGVSIGCVCSVKWVGLFVTVLVGFYTILDLLVKFYQAFTPLEEKKNRDLSVFKYLVHWFTRIVCLIIIPFIIYVTAFRVHFLVLSKSGPGDGSISTLLQASLEGNTLKNGPRSVAYGSLVTLRSQGLSPNLLHSHPLIYPEGSRQQQVTTYGFKDDNNEFLIEFDMETGRDQKKFATLVFDEQHPEYILNYKTLVKDGDTIRLNHKNTGCFIHTHNFPGHVSKGHLEATCYGNMDIDDEKDNWIIEVQTQDRSPHPDFQDEDDSEIHPVSTNFRLRNKVLGCYLATTGYAYPAWGFTQGEVICKKSYLATDKSTWWNFEDHTNNEFESPATHYVAPKPKFFKEFILLNYGMMASNNALIPDTDHYDSISSSWWEWPTLKAGLYMGSRLSNGIGYYLVGHPFTTAFSTMNILVASLTLFGVLLAWQRQALSLSVYSKQWDFFLSAGLLPLLGWVLHYVPFVIMKRVTYVHHYVPAMYFAIFVSAFVIEFYVERMIKQKYIKRTLFCIAYALVIGVFWHFRPLTMGMLGPATNYNYLKLYKSWKL